MNRYFYIYNRHQANYFIKNGLPVLEFNKGKQDDYFVKFLRNNNSEAVFSKWLKEKETLKIKN